MAAPSTLQALCIGTPPTQAVPCEPLGGSILVQGLRLSQRLALRDRVADDPHRFAAVLLELSCVDDAGKPLATADQWDAFAAQHQDAARPLLDAALSLGGFDQGAARGN